MATVSTSQRFTLNLRDVLKGLLVAVITPVFTIILSSLQAGSIVFDWKAIGITALTAGLAYIMKNFLSPAEIVLTNPSKEIIKDVEKGDAKLTVTPT